MFGIFRSPPDTLVIDDGRVACPVRRCDVEIDVCAGCNWFREIDETAKTPFLRCRAERLRCSPILF